MRIAIFGTGGVGGYFGARLALAGADVTFIARGDHLHAIRQDGLRIDTPNGELRVCPAQATDSPAEVGPVDLVLVGVKTWQIGDAAQAIVPMIGSTTLVMPLQNGVEAASQLAAAIGSEHVLAGLCGSFSWIAGPGRIRSIGDANFIRFGEFDNRRSARVTAVLERLQVAGVKADIPADIHAAIWSKFLLVSSFGGVGALTRAPIGVIRTLPETRRMLERCMVEVRDLAHARGIALADTVVADTMGFVDTLAPAGTTSLQRDIIAGQASELEAWSGAVVRLGRESGVPTPLHDFIYDSLLAQEMRARGRLVFPA